MVSLLIERLSDYDPDETLHTHLYYTAVLLACIETCRQLLNGATPSPTCLLPHSTLIYHCVHTGSDLFSHPLHQGDYLKRTRTQPDDTVSHIPNTQRHPVHNSLQSVIIDAVCNVHLNVVNQHPLRTSADHLVCLSPHTEP
jgi:hypothetical protein